jgi:hypothetical protein
MAATKPILGAHIVCKILRHIAAWTKAVRRRLQGDLARLTPEEDLAGGGRTNCGGSERGVGPPGAEPILQSMSSVYVTLHGLVQHHLYHAGQIALLKKAVGPR